MRSLRRRTGKTWAGREHGEEFGCRHDACALKCGDELTRHAREKVRFGWQRRCLSVPMIPQHGHQVEMRDVCSRRGAKAREAVAPWRMAPGQAAPSRSHTHSADMHKTMGGKKASKYYIL